jgi:hypothetical protein
VHGLIVQVIERGIALGQVDPALDPKEAVSLLLALADGVLMRIQHERGADVDGLMPMFERSIRRFLAPPAEAAS